jgi:cell division protease FtsH
MNLEDKPFAEAFKYKDFIHPKSFGRLLQDMDADQVEKVYFSNKLDTIYSKSVVHEGEETTFDDFSMTVTNPALANQIVDASKERKIDTIILQEPTNPFNDAMGIASRTFDTLFFPLLLFLSLSSIIRTFRFNNPFSFSFSNSTNSGSSSPFQGGNPFMPSSRLDVSKDKINMIKANISLASWAGSPEIFEECTEIVSYLKNNTLYKAAGAEIPRGILLEGPPGTGKTLIAKAIASEADANFVSISASEFVEIFVGAGASKVRSLFSQARENAPCIIFIDEIDAVGKQRGSGFNGGNDEREQTLNQILAEMDGFTINDNVLVIAATNRRDILDAALLRPGRFDRIVNVPLPDRASRKEILKLYLANKKTEGFISLDFLAEVTAGFSGAQLKNLVNEAAINAVRLGKEVLSLKNLEDALEKLLVGIVKRVETRPEEILRRIAIHEIGHAFLANYFHKYFILKKVTIKNTYSGTGGFTIFTEYPEIGENGLYTKDLLLKRLVVTLGGKAAESVFYGDDYVSLGAIQDLKQANQLAQSMVGNFGMGKELNVFYNENVESSQRNAFYSEKYSEKTKELFDTEFLELIQSAYVEAVQLIQENKNSCVALVEALLKHNTLDNELIDQYFTVTPTPSPIIDTVFEEEKTSL